LGELTTHTTTTTTKGRSYMDRTKVENIIVGAIDLLYEKDFDLLKRDYDISERTISHRLAIYI
jgi:hypothetical protein